MFLPPADIIGIFGILEAVFFPGEWSKVNSLGNVWVEIQFRLQEQCVGYIQ